MLEGGIKLHLSNDIPYQREKIGSKDIGRWSLLETDSILHDPCYTYHKAFVPYELFEEWNCVLMYALAVLPIEYEAQKLKLVFREFIKWMEDNVCEVIEVEDNIISEDIFINCILVTIKNIRGYLEGNDELGISKNILILLRSRYAYLPTIYKLISQYYKEEVLHKADAIGFSTIKWKELLQEIDKGNCYEKGISLEQIANYFVDCIEGIKVTKRRAKTKNEEMDLVCCNVSENEELWQLGPVVLIECKNWESKVDTKVIRNLSYLMDKKGICTLMLFAKKDITDVARDEILKQAAHNRYILVFTLEELMKIDNNKMKPIDLLISKLNHLENEIMDAMENFM